MPRNAGKQSESGIFHVMLRGIDRQTIFQEEEDCEKYLQCLSDCQKLSGFTLYAHYLMGNHIHLPLPCEAREADCNDRTHQLNGKTQSIHIKFPDEKHLLFSGESFAIKPPNWQ